MATRKKAAASGAGAAPAKKAEPQRFVGFTEAEIRKSLEAAGASEADIRASIEASK